MLIGAIETGNHGDGVRGKKVKVYTYWVNQALFTPMVKGDCKKSGVGRKNGGAFRGAFGKI